AGVIAMQTIAATGANNGARCPTTLTATNQERPAASAVWATGTATLRQHVSRPVTCSPRRARVAEVVDIPLGQGGRSLGSSGQRIFWRLTRTLDHGVKHANGNDRAPQE